MVEGVSTERDAELIAAVRQGDVAAFGVLYRRYLIPARRMASVIAAPEEREDLVAEAFAKVLHMLRAGRGPAVGFLPYLLTTLRNTAITNGRRHGRVSLYADVPEVRRPPDEDPLITRWQSDLAAKAYGTLPERWRVVLWHTEIEMRPPGEVAELLGMRPNGVAALAYRAREGLRKAYLKMCVPEPGSGDCRATAHKLAGWVRNSLSPPLSGKVDAHLRLCTDCRARAEALSEINAELRAVLMPVVLGAAAFLHAVAGT